MDDIKINGDHSYQCGQMEQSKENKALVTRWTFLVETWIK